MPSFLHVLGGGGPGLIPLGWVVEVLPMVALQRTEDAAGRYCGLLQYRGDVLSTFALDDRDADPQAHPEWMLVIVRLDAVAEAWVARDVVGVTEQDDDRVRSPRSGGGRTASVVEIEGVLVPVLDRPAR